MRNVFFAGSYYYFYFIQSEVNAMGAAKKAE